MHSFMYKGLGYKGSMYGCFQPGGLVPAVTASSVEKKGGNKKNHITSSFHVLFFVGIPTALSACYSLIACHIHSPHQTDSG